MEIPFTDAASSRRSRREVALDIAEAVGAQERRQSDPGDYRAAGAHVVGR
jgi:hypothetical protein